MTKDRKVEQMDYYTNIGNQIRNYRKKHHISQAEFAEKLEISTNYLSLIERGLRSPGFSTFLKVIDETHISADQLLQDLTVKGKENKTNELTKKIENLSPKNRKTVEAVLDVLLANLTE